MSTSRQGEPTSAAGPAQSQRNYDCGFARPVSRLFGVCAGTRDHSCTELTRDIRCRSCATEHERGRRPSTTERYGPGHAARHRAVYGQPCALGLPGCSGIATTADHTIPVSRGGIGSELVPACAHCNGARGNMM